MKRISLVLSALLLASLFHCAQAQADVNILVVGSSAAFSDGKSDPEEDAAVKEKAFNPAAIATELRSILENDPAISGSANVVFEDIYRSKQYTTSIGGSGDMWDFTYYCYSLMQYYMWPDGKTNRLDNLRGAAGINWNYVVIMGDPYLMANMPGVFAEGVKLLVDEVSSGTAEPILLAQWPENSSSFSASDFNEIAYRVGESANVRVVPAGKGWDSLSPQDSSSSHPTPDGAYLAASAIYSTLFDKSAKTSSYSYDDSIADHALSVVQANQGVTQYTGVYTNINPFQMKYLKDRTIDFCEYGTSTEEGFYNGLVTTFGACGVTFSRHSGSVSDPVDFSYSRGTDAFEPDKQYDYSNRLDLDNWTYGFPMGDHSTTGAESMRYGIDKRYYGDYWFYNGTDLGVAYSMVMSNQPAIHVRGIPVRLIWSKMHHADCGLKSHRDSWHLSDELNRGVGAFMYTLVSGHCPVGAEPVDDTSTDWKYWFCMKLGYETAWQMSHLTTRVPGFRVLPSSATATNVTPTNSETLTVNFAYAPTSDVTVAVSTDDPFKGKASPSVLTFTPSNYSNAQTVTVLGETGPAGSFAFDVILTASSADPVYNGVSDAWDFMNTRPDGPVPSDIRILGNGITILDGDTTPEAAPGTDFGVTSGSIAHMFTITNLSGATAITLTDSPRVTLTDPAGNFTRTQDASTSTLTPGSYTTFEITYAPLASGIHTATVSVASTDTAVPTYSFVVGGVRPGVPTVTVQGSTTDDPASATVSGELTVGGSVDVWICWGDNDAGTSATGDWDNVVHVGSVMESEQFLEVISGLATNASYWYRVYVTNAAGADWSDGAGMFSGAGTGGASGGGDPVSGAYFEWDAAKDTGGDSTWPSTGTTAYNWTFDAGVQTPGDVTDSRFDLLTKAYDFPAAKDASNTSWDGHGSGEPATLEFVLDVDGSDGSIFETGGSGDGLQVDVSGGAIRGTCQESTPARVSYTLTSNDLARFIHVVFVADQSANNVQLYVDGELKDSQPWALGEDWAGSDAASLGNKSGTNPTGGSTADFTGKVALFRYYRNQALTAEQVTTNFSALMSSGDIANAAPSAVSSSQATLNGELNAQGTSYAVSVHWGPGNGSTNQNGWLNSAGVGTWTNVSTNVSHIVTGLEPGQRYYYTFTASDGVSNFWASPSWQFVASGSTTSRTHTLSHTVPYIWVESQDADWTNDYETSVMSDPDGDGFTTWEEYWSGTDPLNGSSFLKIDAVSYDGSNVQLEWRHADVGSIPPITIEAATNLTTGPWSAIDTKAPVNGTNFWFETASQKLFYRLTVTNAP